MANIVDSVSFDRNKTCCFTGHRNLPNAEKAECAEKLRRVIDAFVKMGVTDFIVGGAIGFDTVAAVTLINLKAHMYPQIKITFAVPFKGQSKYFSAADKALYNRTLERADNVVVLSNEYHPYCMSVRNRYMVDNSRYCVSYLTSEKGGTFQTVRYAKSNDLTLFNLADPIWNKK